METVPLEVLETTIMNMEPREILNLCETSTYYQEVVCRNEKLWKQLLIRDFPQAIDWITQYGSWMSTYRAMYLYEQDVNRIVSDIVEKLRNNEYTEDWGISFQPLSIDINLIPIKQIRDIITKLLNDGEDEDSIQIILRPYMEKTWVIDIEMVYNNNISEEEVDVTEKDLRKLLHSLVWNQIRLYDVGDDDILDYSYIHPSKY